MLGIVGDRPVRLTYDRGDVELMSPSYDHERFKSLIGRLIETLTDGARHPVPRRPARRPGGSRSRTAAWSRTNATTWPTAERVIGRKVDLDVDPPPDLAIEVEISRSALDRMGIYAALGVPEVWRYDGEALRVEQLQPDGTYAEVTASPSLPFLPLDEVVRWLRLADTMGQTTWLRQFREWVRDELAPRLEGAVSRPPSMGSFEVVPCPTRVSRSEDLRSTASGSIAVEEVPAGAVILEYTGERVSREEARRREAATPGVTYIFRYDDESFIDGSAGGNEARFINHSCAPNCTIRREGGRAFIDRPRGDPPRRRAVLRLWIRCGR